MSCQHSTNKTFQIIKYQCKQNRKMLSICISLSKSFPLFQFKNLLFYILHNNFSKTPKSDYLLYIPFYLINHFYYFLIIIFIQTLSLSSQISKLSPLTSPPLLPLLLLLSLLLLLLILLLLLGFVYGFDEFEINI